MKDKLAQDKEHIAGIRVSRGYSRDLQVSSDRHTIGRFQFMTKLYKFHLLLQQEDMGMSSINIPEGDHAVWIKRRLGLYNVT